jgi:transposase
VAIGLKSFLHLGSAAGGGSTTVIYTLIGTANLNGINPQHDLRDVLERIAAHPINRIDELLPWVVADQIAPDTQAVPTEQTLPLAA